MVAGLTQTVSEIRTIAGEGRIGKPVISTPRCRCRRARARKAAGRRGASSSMEEMVSNHQQNADNAAADDKIANKSARTRREREEGFGGRRRDEGDREQDFHH